MFSLSSILLLSAAPLMASAQLVQSGPLATDQASDMPGSQLLRGGSRELATWNFWAGKMAGYATFFHGMGRPFGGCGVPPENAYDDNGRPLPFIALNVNSQWMNGGNCGRWVEITLGTNCIMGGNTQWSVCNNGHFENDHNTGKVIYGYVMDSCNDMNYWCQNDPYHLDISEKYLESIGMRHGPTFAARKLHWKYIDHVPNGWTMQEPEFMIMEGSRSIGYEFWVSVIIKNVKNGISRVEQLMPWGWDNVNQLTNLGNTYELKNPDEGNAHAWTDTITLRVWGKSNDFYGAFEIKYPCGMGHCYPSQHAPVVRRL